MIDLKIKDGIILLHVTTQEEDNKIYVYYNNDVICVVKKDKYKIEHIIDNIYELVEK